MKNNLLLIVFYCGVLILILFLIDNLLGMKELFINSLSEKLAIEQVKNLIAFQERWQWVSYAIIPVFL